MDALFENYISVVSMVLFGIGFGNLLLQKNLIKKIIGLNIMDTAVYLFLASMGYISGRLAPIITDGATTAIRSRAASCSPVSSCPSV